MRTLVKGLTQGKSACIFCSNHLCLSATGSFSPTLDLVLIELGEKMSKYDQAHLTVSVTSFELFAGEVYDLLSPIGGGALEAKVRCHETYLTDVKLCIEWPKRVSVCARKYLNFQHKNPNT